MSATSKNLESPVDSDLTIGLSEAKSFMRKWFKGRAKVTDSAGNPLLTEDELRFRQDNVEKAIVIEDPNPAAKLKEMVLRGELHLWLPSMREPFLERLDAMMESGSRMELLGLCSNYIKEPVIVINPRGLLEGNLYFRQNEGQVIPGSLQSLLVHELGHIANPDDLQIGKVREILKRHNGEPSYRNDPREVYARLFQLRKLLGVDPSHKFTIEEIKEIRKRIQEDQKAYSKELREARKQGALELRDLPIEGKVFDPMLFEEFSDKEIMNLLNGTAMRDTRELEREHLPGLERKTKLVRGDDAERNLSSRVGERRTVTMTGEAVGAERRMGHGLT